MGEVYRARDTKLGREVAIKVLPASLSADPERLSRFEREARVLASLNHPHVAAIYGVEDSTAVKALVLELVEGPTLQDRIEAGPLPVDEALPIGRQIAEALEAAHEKGIVHRDLKPANVKVDAEGNVKVLDFGLAKALDPTLSSTDLTDSPTVSVGTQSGMILGTAPYMSPEQARGRPVDKRTDIWAFGVVLWEMLTGRRLFDGDSVADVLGAVMREEIDLGKVPASVPPRVRELLRRCLERNPRERLRDIGEARIVLEHEDEAPAATVRPAPGASPRRIGRGLLAGVAAAGIALGLGAGIALSRRSRSAPSFRFRKLTFLPGLEWGPELTADGKTLFFAAGDTYRSDIYSVPVGGKKPTALTAGSDAFNDAPRLSPDGGRLAFASTRDGGGLFLMGVNGESVRKLSPAGTDPAWSPDGRSIAYSTEHLFLPYLGIDGGTLGLVDVATGARRELKTGDAHQPSWSPSGRRLAYWGMRNGGQRDIWTIAIDGGSPVDVTNDPAVDWNPVWSEDGRFLYFLSDRGGQMNLWRIAIDEKSGKIRGAPESVPLPADEVIDLARSGGRWVYSAYSSRTMIRRLDFDPVRSSVGGAPREIVSMTGSVMSAAPSPDGRTIAFSTLWPQEDVYVVPSQGGTPVQLTDDPEFDRYVSWSPDGKRILFESLRNGRYETWAIHPDGSGLEPLTRTAPADSGWVPLLSPAGDRLATSLADGIALFDARGTAPWEHPKRFLPPPGPPGTNFGALAWSPDGRRIGGYVYRGNDPPRAAVLDLDTKAYRIFDPPSRTVGWYPDGLRLLVIRENRLATIDLATGKTSPVSGSPELGAKAWASGDLRAVVGLDEDRQADVWLAEELPSR